MRRLRVLTWHIHGNYLYYLAQAQVELYLPVCPGRPGYGGRGTTFPFGDNVHDVPADEVRQREFDCILFQHRRNYEIDQHELLSPAQRRLPRICLEHDPPRTNAVDAVHYCDDPQVLLVHVTPFNALMWNSGRTPCQVIDHGILIPPGVQYSGVVPRGVVIVNHLRDRGRAAGSDLFLEARRQVPLDLVGMDAESLGGVGEVAPPELPAFAAGYRFYFHPLRYTSLGLALLEAMFVGLPVVGLATTELVTVIRHGESGFIDTDPARLVAPMRHLLADAGEARRIGQAGRRAVEERFHISRFARDWEATFAQVTGSERLRHRQPWASRSERGETTSCESP